MNNNGNIEEIARSRDNEKGVIMVIVLFLMILLITIGVGLLSLNNIDLKIAGNKQREREAFHAAESGVEMGIYDVWDVFENLGVFDNNKYNQMLDANQDGVADVVKGFSVTYDVTVATDANGVPLKPFLYQTMMQGAPAFHTAYEYQVTSTAIATGEQGAQYKKTVIERFRIIETPLVQYYAFNSGDLEITPGASMRMWGRIHANGDIYLGPEDPPVWVFFQDYPWNYAGAGSPLNVWTPNIITTAKGFISRQGGKGGAGGIGPTYILLANNVPATPPVVPTVYGATFASGGDCGAGANCPAIPASANFTTPAVIVPANFANKVRDHVPPATAPSTQALKRNLPLATPGQPGYGFYEYVAGWPLRDVDGLTIVGTGTLDNDCGGFQFFAAHRDPTNPSLNFDHRDVTALLCPAAADRIPEVVTGTNAPDVQAPPAAFPNHPVVWRDTAAFTDQRAGRSVNLTEVNLNRIHAWWCDYLFYLKNGTIAGSGAVCSSGTNKSSLFAPGGMIVFISRSPTPPTLPQAANSANPLEAVRLDNEDHDELWERTSAVSDNPMYIIGDNINSGYNAGANWVGFAAVADSLTLLSKAFTTGATMTAAVPSTFNVAIFAGEYPDGTGRAGGIENFARLLEQWDAPDKALNISGCFIDIWKDAQDDAPWVYGSPRYTRPLRNFGWDYRFGNPDNWPPYVPSIFNVERVSWFEN